MSKRKMIKSIIIGLVITTILVVGILFYIYQKVGELPTGGKFVNDQEMQEMIQEAEKNGAKVDIVE